MNVINIKNILLRLPRIQKRILVAAGDACACAFSFWLSFGIGLDSWGLIAGDKIQILLLSLCIAAPIFYAFGLYLAIFRYVGALALRSILLAFIIYAIIFLAALLIAFRDTPIGVGILHLLIFFSGIGLSRWFIRHWLGGVNSKIIRSHYSKPRILIYGAGSAGRQLKAALAINRAMILKGFVDDNKSLHGNLIDGIPILGPHELQGAIDRYKITDVIFAIPSAKQKNRNEIIESLSKLGVKVQTLPGLFERHSGRIRLSDVKKFDMNDLLGREAVPPNYSLLKQNVGNKVVLVTGAGGSIGSELCRQIIKYLPTSIILVDNSEYALYIVEKELLRLISEQVPPEVGSSDKVQIDVFPCLVSVQDFDGLERIMATHKPNIVFHAAAYKHVTLVEKNPADGIKNNIRNAIIAYRNSKLNKFGAKFILSKMQDSIDSTNLNSIVGSESVVRLQKRFLPILNQSKNYAIDFNAPLKRGTITNKLTSTSFNVLDVDGIERTVIFDEIPQSSSGITSIGVTDAGTGYTSAPTVTITGDGTGATAEAIIVNGRVQNINIVDRGTDYTRAVVTITGGDGYGARATAVVDGRIGTLRTIYYDSAAQRQIVDDNVGEIDYTAGLINIFDINMLSVASADGYIRLSFESEKGIVETIRSTIITIDETDPTSITIDLVKISD
jgi:NAD(P)-dependent dehydrogenase (short-subunit alcohol dehydrogenase family)